MATSVESMPSGTETLPKSDITELTENRQIDRNSIPIEAPYKLESKKDGQEEKKKEQNQTEDGKVKNDNQQKAKIFDNKTFVEAPLPKINPWNKPTQPRPTVALSQTSQNQDLGDADKGKTGGLSGGFVKPEPVVQSPTAKVVVANTVSGKIDTKASDFSDAANWPALSEVQPQQIQAPTSQQQQETQTTPKAQQQQQQQLQQQQTQTSNTKAVAPQPIENDRQSHSHTDSGGDDSSKENKESSNGDENGKNGKKRGNKQKWVPLDIDPPKTERRRGKKRGENSALARKRALSKSDKEPVSPGSGDGPVEGSSSAAGPDSKNWRENMQPLSPKERGGERGTFRGRRGRGGRGGGRGARGGRGRGDGSGDNLGSMIALIYHLITVLQMCALVS